MKTISSFYTNNGQPAIGLSPTIRIWHIGPASNNLIITDDPMVEVGDGFYLYHFNAYDVQKDYLIRTDGSATLAPSERFQHGNNSNAVDEIWNATSNDYLQSGTTGFAQAQTLADVQALRVDMTTSLDIVNELLKYQKNRTLVDPAANTLTIFEDDGTTVLRVFNLKDDSGQSSSDCVFERIPQ